MNASINELCRSPKYMNTTGREMLEPIKPRGATQGIAATTNQPKGVEQPVLDVPEKKSMWTKIGDFLSSPKAQNTLTQAQILANQIAEQRGGGSSVQGSTGQGSSSPSGGGGGKDGGKSMMYVYLGLAVVAVGTVAYFVFKKK